MTTVIGIDPSTKKLAVAIARLDGAGLELMTKPLPADKLKRVAVAYEWLHMVVEDATVDDQDVHIFLEDPIVWGGARTAIVLGQISGACIAASLLSNPSSFHMANNSRWKAQTVGSGKADKPMIGRWVHDVWPHAYELAQGDEDLHDAICIQRYGSEVIKRSKRLGKIMEKPVVKRRRVVVRRSA